MLVQMGGLDFAQHVLSEHNGLILRNGSEDRLVFTWARNGIFTVKEAYKMLKQLQPLIKRVPTPAEKKVWKQI